MKIFKRDQAPEDYNGPRETDGIVKHMRGKVGPASVEITSTAQLDEKLKKNVNAVTLVGFFVDADKLKEFTKAADSVRDSVFCMHTSSKDVMKSAGHTE